MIFGIIDDVVEQISREVMCDRLLGTAICCTVDNLEFGVKLEDPEKQTS